MALAPLVALACAAGLGHASKNTHAHPQLAAVLTALAALLVLASALWLTRQRERPQWPTLLTIAAGIFCLVALSAAWRKAAPAGDISWLVHNRPVPNRTQDPLHAKLRGWVAASPQTSDFSTEFPLEIDTTYINDERYLAGGRVWCRIPYGIPVGVGDALALQVVITDLPRIGNRGERDGATHFVEDDCWCLARASAAEDVRVLRRGEQFRLARAIDAVGSKLTSRYEQNFRNSHRPYPHATAQLLTAMVFGEGALQESLPGTLSDAFRGAGLSHLLVASGGQIAISLVVLLGIARLTGLRNGWLLIVIIPGLLAYALVAGSSASIWRAVIAGLCITWGLLQGRDADGLSLWSIALIVLLLVDPLQLHDIGFQLTFAATWGLIVLAPRLQAQLSTLFRSNLIIEAAVLSLAAQIATTPLLFYHFGRISVSGLAGNLIAVPLTGFLVCFGLLGLVFPPVNGLNYLLTNKIQDTAFAAASVHGAGAATIPLELPATLFIYGLILMMLPTQQFWLDLQTMFGAEWKRWCKRTSESTRDPAKRLGWLVALVILVVAIAGLARGSGQGGKLTVTILDVGQGESIVIRSPAGRTVMIDGGTSSTEKRADVGHSIIVPYLQSMGVHRLDAMFVTHADSDHCNGLKAVVQEVPVTEAIDGAAAVSGKSYATETDYLALHDEWNRHHVRTMPAKAGERFDLGGGATLTMLAPLPPFFDDDNNNCEIMRLDYGKTSFLFTGDAEGPEEDRLIQSGANLRCTILKVGHHGSHTSTSAAFLQRAQPQVAVISCGRYNAYHHPAPETLERLARKNIATFRTDRDGAVEFTSDGSESWVQTMR